MYITDITNKHSAKENKSKANFSASKSLPRHLKIGSPLQISDLNFFDITKDKLFVSKCISLICQIPYVVAYRVFLNNLYKCLPRKPGTCLSLESYVANIMFDAIAPYPGSSIKIYLPPENPFLNPIELKLTRPQSMPLLDYPLKKLFKYLDVDVVVGLYTCILLECQILLHSCDFEKLTLVGECMTSLLFPFVWPHVYAPILPLSMLHFLDAPVPYIMGTTSELNDIKFSDRTCYVNIDENRIKIPLSVPELPFRTNLKSEIKNYLKKSQVNTNLFSSKINDRHKMSSFCTLPHGRPTEHPMSIHKIIRKFQKNVSDSCSREINSFQEEYDENVFFNLTVREIFLNHLVLTLLNYENYVIYPKKKKYDRECKISIQNFDKVSFVSDQLFCGNFFSKFVESQMFASFVDDKILSELEEAMNNNILFFDQQIILRKKGKNESISTEISQENMIEIRKPSEVLPNRPAYFRSFPLLDSTIFNNRESNYYSLRNTKNNGSVKSLKNIRLECSLSNSNVPVCPMSPSLIAKANWNFVEQILQDIKNEIKLMVSNDDFVDRDKLISTTFYDIIEKIWNHGLQIKQGNCALWSHMILYLRTSKNTETSNTSTILKSDIRNILNLTVIKTDSGYAKAWIRLALEKKKLSQHLRTLLSEEFLLKTLYRRTSFLRSEEEKEQFLYHILSLSTVDFTCFTNSYPTAKIPYQIKLNVISQQWNVGEIEISGSLSKSKFLLKEKTIQTIFLKNLGFISSIKASTPSNLEKITVTNNYTCVEFASKFTNVTSEPPEQTSSEIQSNLCDCVTNIVKWHQKTTKEKQNKTLNMLLCSKKGLVHCLELVFLFGMRQNIFQEQNDKSLWGLIVKFKDIIDAHLVDLSIKRTFHQLTDKLDSLPDHNRFELFVCLCTREKILVDIILQIGTCFAENEVYNKPSFFVEQRLANFLKNILKPLEEYDITLDDEITMGIQFPSII
ncbi:DENND5B family protein [Megaselia abdita]